MALIWTTTLLYQQDVVGLTPFQMVFLGTVAEIVIFTCEIPTGVVADTISRKLSVVLGLLIVGLGFVLQGLVPQYWALVIGMMGWGLGETFLSGAREAWVADEIRVEDPDFPAFIAFLRGSQFGHLGSFIGIWCSVLVARSGLQWPTLAGGVGLVFVATSTALLMPERGFHKTAEQERLTWAAMKETMTNGAKLARSNRRLLDVMLAVFLIGVASEAFDRLYASHFTRNILLPELWGQPSFYWFAILRSVALALTILTLGQLQRRGISDGSTASFTAMGLANLVLVIATFGFALAGSLAMGAVCYVLAITMRRTMDPLAVSIINSEAEPNVRATLLSFQGQAHGLGEVLGGPLLGAVASLAGIRAALLGSASIAALASVPVLLARKKR